MLVHSHSQGQGSDGSCISVIVVAMKYLGLKLGYWGDSYIILLQGHIYWCW